jgi:hypothetical protein
MAIDHWLQPKQALDMLSAAGAQPAEAWHIVADAMRQGRIRCHAASMTTHFVGEGDDFRSNIEVPCDAWKLGVVPPPGHMFWTTGDANLTIRLPGSQTMEQALRDDLSLAPVSPTIEVRGARLDCAGTELLIYERALRGASVDGEAEGSAILEKGSTKKPNTSKRRGRTPGAGSYAAVDAPLLAEMKQLLAEQKALSVHQAAKLVAERAHGGGTIDSRASRLARSYRASERNGAN